MSFLAPWAGLLALLGVPVVLLYLMRPRFRNRTVSTLLFWDALAPRLHNSPLWRQLRRWFSLALQLLFLALLVFALARPVGLWQARQAQSWMVVLDASASMAAAQGSETRFQRAVAEAQSIVRGLRAFDEASILLAGRNPEVLSPWTPRRRALHSALASAEPGTEAGDIGRAMWLARALADSRTNGRIVLITDGVFQAPGDAGWLDGVEVRRVGSDDAANVGIALFAAGRSAGVASEIELTARLEHNLATPSDAELELVHEGRPVDVQRIALAPGEAVRRSWRFTAVEGGRYELILKRGAAPDALPLDDRAELRVPPLQDIRAQIIAAPPASDYINAALAALPAVDRDILWPPERAAERWGAADVVLATVAVPSNVLDHAAVVVFRPDSAGFWGQPKGALDQPFFEVWDVDAPLFRFVAWDSVRLRAAAGFDPPDGVAVWAECLGNPLVWGRWNPNARWVATAFGLGDSDWTLRTAFPIFLANFVDQVRGGRSVVQAPLPGAGETTLRASALPGADVRPARPILRGVAGLPLWVWALSLGAVWLVVEWWSYTRRLTE